MSTFVSVGMERIAAHVQDLCIGRTAAFQANTHPVTVSRRAPLEVVDKLKLTRARPSQTNSRHSSLVPLLSIAYRGARQSGDYAAYRLMCAVARALAMTRAKKPRGGVLEGCESKVEIVPLFGLRSLCRPPLRLPQFHCVWSSKDHMHTCPTSDITNCRLHLPQIRSSESARLVDDFPSLPCNTQCLA